MSALLIIGFTALAIVWGAILVAVVRSIAAGPPAVRKGSDEEFRRVDVRPGEIVTVQTESVRSLHILVPDHDVQVAVAKPMTAAE